MSDVKNSPLGKSSDYPSEYAPQVLFGVARGDGRRRLGFGVSLPFSGVDLWTAYEISWLDGRGKPRVAIGEFQVPADSVNIIESKSLKLYLNSLQLTRFGSSCEVSERIASDLADVAGAAVAVKLYELQDAPWVSPGHWHGTCIDDLDVAIDDYELDSTLLRVLEPATRVVEETLHSHLLKSNCPVTGQPDWGSVMIRYKGAPIDREALLRYIVSYRNTAEFHEHCAEQIFADVKKRCNPERLTVYARYTRRGGLDINPFRSDFEQLPDTVRLARQ